MPKSKKGAKGSSTPGRQKGDNCHRSVLKNLYCRDPRLYRTNPELYEKACIEVGTHKGNIPYRPQTETETVQN